jgi:hypothetical protein
MALSRHIPRAVLMEIAGRFAGLGVDREGSAHVFELDFVNGDPVISVIRTPRVTNPLLLPRIEATRPARDAICVNLNELILVGYLLGAR